MRPSEQLLRVVCGAILFIGGARVGHAQMGAGMGGAEGSFGELVLQTYEVGDLVLAVPDYQVGPGGSGAPAGSTGGRFGGGISGGGMSGGAFGRGMGMGMEMGAGMAGEMAMGAVGTPSPGALPLTVESILQVIQSTVSPGSWQATGGSGQATALGTALVVLQTPDAQRSINDLLTALREGSGGRPSLTVDARWLMLNSDELDQLVTVAEGGKRKIDRQVLAELTRQPSSLRAIVNCFSGQAVYLTSGTVRSSVSSYIPVVGSIEPPRPEAKFASYPGDGAITLVSDDQSGAQSRGRNVGYQPVIATHNFGVEFQVRPTRLHAEEAAVVDLRSTITFPDQAGEGASSEPAGETLAPKVDRVAIQTQELATTLRAPLGEPVLVGGMTDVAPQPGADMPAAAAERPQLYLLLEVR